MRCLTGAHLYIQALPKAKKVPQEDLSSLKRAAEHNHCIGPNASNQGAVPNLRDQPPLFLQDVQRSMYGRQGNGPVLSEVLTHALEATLHKALKPL